MSEAVKNDMSALSISELDEMLLDACEADIIPIKKIKNACAELRSRGAEAPFDVNAGWEGVLSACGDDAVYSHEEIMSFDRASGSFGKKHRIVKRIAVIAAAAAVLAALSIGAFGEGFSGKAVNFVKDVFSLPIGNGFVQFDTIQEAMEAYGADTTGLPEGIAEGYVITTMTVDVQPGAINYFAEYQNGRSNYHIAVTQHTEYDYESPAPYDTELTITEGSRCTANWEAEKCIYSLRGDLTPDEITGLFE